MVETKTKVEDAKITKTSVKAESKLPELPTKTESQMEQILDMMSSLIGRIEKIENKEIVVTPVVSTASQAPTAYTKETDDTYPKTYVPAQWRKLVDDILTPDFGLTVDDFTDRTDFQINIIVPDQYSSLTPKDREQGVKDIRSKIITRAMGENGVREWAQKVRMNLNRYFIKEGKASPFK